MRSSHFLLGMCLLLVGGCALGTKPMVTASGEISYLESGAKILRVIKRNGDEVTSKSGGGIYIGHGLILTAAHIVQGAQDGDPAAVALGGESGSGVVFKHSLTFRPGQDDIAVIKLFGAWYVDPRSPALPICVKPVVNSAGLLIVSFRFLYRIPDGAKWLSGQPSTVPGTYEPGTSGSAVIDPARNCIVGVISYGSTLDLNAIHFSSEVDGISLAGEMAYTPAVEIMHMLDAWHLPYYKAE